MSVKPYTMREMNTIVEYLNTHKAYGEIKGRKLWTDFASTKVVLPLYVTYYVEVQLTNRTWQSLKETFLKRILPDIHNPYYGLTRSEIASFKQGYDVDARSNNKLDIQTISDDSNHSHADNNHDNEKPSTSNNVADNKPGEKMSPSTLDARHRASTETIILENCYETPEDIQRDLESPKSDKADKTEKETPSKSLRDLITYAEPLTPMMQQVLDDFASDDEGNLEIVENTENRNEEINNKENPEMIPKLPENDKQGDTFNNKIEERLSEIVETAESVNIPLGQESKTAENKSARNSSIIENGTCNDDAKMDEKNIDNEKKKENFVDFTIQTANTQNKSSQVPTQNTNNSTDTTIPGNQEALKKNQNTMLSESGNVTKDDSKDLALSRKRSNSHDANPNKKKEKMLGLKKKKKSQSETEDKQQSKKLKLNSISEGDNANEELEKQATDSQTKEKNNSKESDGKELQINPCLSSVSLYDEQFNKTKYTDSDSSNNSIIDDILNIQENTNKKSPKVLKKAANVKEVVILKSHSESDDSKAAENNKEKVEKTAVDKKERDRALASVFGFSTGAVGPGRKRRISRRHRSTSYNHNNGSESSEWTSESDSEYVSPPRGRRNRRSRKYLKPKSARILSLEEEGGLFVMHGKRIYPVVKDGKIVKNYLTFSPESDPEDDPNYWKKKYEEERKKTEELKKMVEEVKDKKPIREQSPVLPLNTRLSAALQSPPKLVPIPDEPKAIMPAELPTPEVKAPEKTLKIKFTKNNEELQIEGHWSQLHPVLADVVHIFNKDSDHGKEAGHIKEAAPREQVNGKADADEILSLRSSPMDEEAVRKKVEKLEEEIFKEIEELDKSEREQAAASANDQEANVNKRKRIGRPRKSLTVTKSADSSSSPSRGKRAKAAKKTDVNGGEAVGEPERPKRLTKSPKKIASEISTIATGVEKKTPKRTPRKSAKPEPETTRPSIDEDADVRYMFPPELNARKSVSQNKTPNARSLTVPTNPTSENLSHNSIESTQGYQDSDASPAKERVMLKRKRKLSLSTLLYRGKQKRYTRRRSYPCVSDDASSESSNLSFKLPEKNSSNSIKSYVYRSESYQLLMPGKKPRYTTLSKIDEMSPTCNHEDDKSALKLQVESINVKEVSVSPGQMRTECNSSNVSLPSPELSIVENISVCKELLDSLEDFPTINETQGNNDPSSDAQNKYLMSAVDVTMPLMAQNCEIRESITSGRLDTLKSPGISDSLLTKVNSVHIAEGPSITDSLDSRLRNLLLESAKKMEIDTLRAINENCDNVVKSNTEVVKKTRSRKLSSTPHKRNSKKKSKAPDIEPVVEEERMEYCSYGGRQSCPPSIQMLPDNISNNADISKTENVSVKKGRKKKDVIKVKILKPIKKQKKVSPAKVTQTKLHDVTTISAHTDSGINETSSAFFLQDTDDSVDLIHNHSETCLQTRECVGNSIEFVDDNMSVISINSQEATEFRDAENIPPEVFCNDARDGTAMIRANTMSSQETSETVYHSPLGSDLSGNSLITEDLSDDANEAPNPRRTKWYLFSEDETTNTNHVPSFGSNLNKIFPVTCAVPDLSTITEMSKENDSRKPTLEADGDTRNDLDSQTTF